jgi:hypothetical protein
MLHRRQKQGISQDCRGGDGGFCSAIQQIVADREDIPNKAWEEFKNSRITPMFVQGARTATRDLSQTQATA